MEEGAWLGCIEVVAMPVFRRVSAMLLRRGGRRGSLAVGVCVMGSLVALITRVQILHPSKNEGVQNLHP